MKKEKMIFNGNAVAKWVLFIKQLMRSVFIIRYGKLATKASIKDNYESPVINKEIIASTKIKQSVLN